MADIERGAIEALAARLAEIEGYLHVDKSRARVVELEKASARPGFWDDADDARSVMAELASIRGDVAEIDATHDKIDDALAAFDLGSEMADEDLLAEAAQLAVSLEADLSDLELSSWFSDDLDHGDAIVTVTPGQGGLEAQDWCDMLFHMYLRYCERRRWKVTVNDAPQADVIGIDRATFTVSGKDAYGMLRAEQGVHRLVRISPTDDKKRRQTTFAGVEVLPVLPDDIEVDIDPSDLRVDVYHATGHGGQGVNTTDSAVRITHIPTGTVVTCQNERSQLQNKAFAMKILRSRLYEQELAKRAAEIDELRGPKHDIGFGNQIRSYVLYPYQLVKDLRTGVETGNVDSVLSDGDLDRFIVGYHRWVTGGDGEK
jgi:peptide chain release factor 2